MIPLSLLSALSSLLPAPLVGLGLEVAQGALLLGPKPRGDESESDDGAHRLWRWVEDNGEWVFPLIGIAIIALVVMAVRKGTLSQAEELHKKSGQKDEIIRLVRRKLMLTPDSVSAELGIERFHAAALLDEMAKEGKLVQSQKAGGVLGYRLKGL